MALIFVSLHFMHGHSYITGYQAPCMTSMAQAISKVLEQLYMYAFTQSKVKSCIEQLNHYSA